MLQILMTSLPGRLTRIALLALVPMIAIHNPVLADPPPWAPAHGYYKNKNKNKHQYKNTSKYYDGRYDDRHHDDASDMLPWLAGAAASAYLLGDRCNRESLGAVLGGVVGGVAGSQIGKGDSRKAATIAGALIGVLVGQSIGRYMDTTDQYCTGQALEYAPDNQSVKWDNPDIQSRYQVTPVNNYEARDGRYCREYTSQADVGARQQQVYGTACRQPDGAWEVVQ